MKIQMLGTAAAEGWPCPFCACTACARAREIGGKEIRGKAGLVIDDCVKVDFGPDTMSQAQKYGIDFRKLTTLLFTHTHNDHFAPLELQYREPSYVTMGGLPMLHIYGSEGVMTKVKKAFPDGRYETFMLAQPLRPFLEVTTDDETTVLPLPAQHSSDMLLMRIKRGSSYILQGHDSGPFPEETVEALRGKKLDLVLLDCTYGPKSGRAHMGIADVLETTDRLRRVGAIQPDTQIVATHFSHNGGLLHEELVSRFAPYGVKVAYDGMTLQTP
jgi:phosphoribosyl 1,2-cyclic phosphate phosphodiesterase